MWNLRYICTLNIQPWQWIINNKPNHVIRAREASVCSTLTVLYLAQYSHCQTLFGFNKRFSTKIRSRDKGQQHKHILIVINVWTVDVTNIWSKRWWLKKMCYGLWTDGCWKYVFILPSKFIHVQHTQTNILKSITRFWKWTISTQIARFSFIHPFQSKRHPSCL